MSNAGRSIAVAALIALAPAGGAERRLPSRARPPGIDLRPPFEAWGLGRRVQGSRGTCSAFTIAGALEFAAAKQQGRATRLSVEFLNWASNKVVGDAADGGFFSDLWKGFAAHGICPEEDAPYLPAFVRGLEPSQRAIERARPFRDLGFRLHWIKEWDVKTGLTDAQLEAIRATLRTGWPVCGGFRWPKQEAWEDDATLRMVPADAVRDGHSVLLVGYRDDPQRPGGGRFIIRNTANDGRDGFMTYEYVKEYMNDAVWIESAAGSREPESAPGSASAARPAPSTASLLGLVGAAPIGRNRRVSSNEQPAWNDGDLDMTSLAPGQAVEFPVLEGPGVITHIWLTSHAGWTGELDALSLRIYWDGREQPGVEAPVGDFFAVGQGRPAPVESVPVQVSPSGSLSCFWRMPFERSARIVIANDNPDRWAGLYWQVDWVKLDALPPDTPYFHARFRREYPARAGTDYLLADLEGRGMYVGTVMSVTLAQDGWFGEGDDFFFVDGEGVPSLQGTGSEDYFNDAWGFRPRTGPWFGQPRWQGDTAGDSGGCYRWHVLDPICFARSLRAAIEHKGNHEIDEDGFFLERPDFVSSVAFWYQVGEPKRGEPLPPWSERRIPWKIEHLVKRFREAAVSGGSGPKVSTEGFFGARPVLLWEGAAAGARLTVPFTVEGDGTYAVRLTAWGAPQQGSYDIELDGKVAVRAADFRSPESTDLDLRLGTHALGAGKHTVGFVAASPAGPLGVELLRLLKLPPAATRAVKTDDEAHFIRLGIGRAVYAYRLAYGELPESLEVLARSGIMRERYLRDENGVPLASRREGDYLVVESKGPGAWQHRWQGLDARR